MNDRGNWLRCTRKTPCAICGKVDWCGVTADGAVSRCMRVQSDRPSGEGWLHNLGGRPIAARRAVFPRAAALQPAGFGRLAESMGQGLSDACCASWAEHLGVEAAALRAL